MSHGRPSASTTTAVAEWRDETPKGGLPVRPVNVGDDPVLQPALYAQFISSVETIKKVYENSHKPQGAFGYLVDQIDPHPRLTVATHFTVDARAREAGAQRHRLPSQGTGPMRCCER